MHMGPLVSLSGPGGLSPGSVSIYLGRGLGPSGPGRRCSVWPSAFKWMQTLESGDDWPAVHFLRSGLMALTLMTGLCMRLCRLPRCFFHSQVKPCTKRHNNARVAEYYIVQRFSVSKSRASRRPLRPHTSGPDGRAGWLAGRVHVFVI
jgi:hypothetical protein